MKNSDEIISALSKSKEFVEKQRNEVKQAIYNDIIDCLDEAKGAVREDDVVALKSALQRIDEYAVDGWAITRDVWALV